MCLIFLGIAEDPSNAAGFWGDYSNCDIPLWTLEALYEDIANNHQVRLIVIGRIRT